MIRCSDSSRDGRGGNSGGRGVRGSSNFKIAVNIADLVFGPCHADGEDIDMEASVTKK